MRGFAGQLESGADDREGADTKSTNGVTRVSTQVTTAAVAVIHFPTVLATGTFAADISMWAAALLPSAIVGLFAVLAWVWFVVKRRRLVVEASNALSQLDDLNSRFEPLVPPLPPIQLDFRRAVDSKAKFNRFDLYDYLTTCILEQEQWVQSCIDARLSATGHFATYNDYFEGLARETLGRSSHPRVNSGQFARIEQKLFLRRKLSYPTPAAQITATVSYRSPQGKNSYSKRLGWDFNQLHEALLTAQVTRAHQTTTQALRARERSLMSSALRVQILRRDGSRCKMCGISASDGAIMHIDHITPVSHGGRTVVANLQTLCEPCNLGKSNKFVG